MAGAARHARRQRARADTKSLADWKIDTARGLVAGLLTILIVARFGLPDDDLLAQLMAVSLFVSGILLVLAAEYAWNYVLADGRVAKDDAARLRAENAELRANREEVDSVRQLQQQQAELYR